MSHQKEQLETLEQQPQSHTMIWFRSDLRIEDNTALQAATAYGQPLVACFIATPAQWRLHDMAAIKARFIADNLNALQRRLIDLGIPLKFRTVDSFDLLPDTLLTLCGECNISRLFANHEYGVNEKNRDVACEQRLSEQSISSHYFHDQSALSPGSVLKPDGGSYKVFTPFSKTWRKQLHWPPGLSDVPRHQTALLIEGDVINDEAFNLGSHPPISWQAGEKAAQKKLRQFAKKAMAEYRQQRDYPAIDGTSSLSPYLAIGVLSPRQCLTVAHKALNNASAVAADNIQCWITEIIWRDFYIHILDQFPRISRHRAFKPATEKLPWSHNMQDFERWCNGQTGVPIIDAAMRQLVQTGWMHNR
ncbi:MAG: deoxyribodipyrimidine photo-lyase, partial [Oceanicoccus sp.]